MSRENRRSEPERVRLALTERDLDVHDERFAAIEKRQDDHEDRIEAVEDRTSANRASRWANIATIGAAFIAAVGGIIVAVLT